MCKVGSGGSGASSGSGGNSGFGANSGSGGFGSGGFGGGFGGSGLGGSGLGGSGFGGSGFGGSGLGGTGGSSCSIHVADPTCDNCLGGACCGQIELCASDTTCMDLMNCLSQSCQSAVTIDELSSCIDTSCAQDASAKTEFLNYLGCASTNCGASCGGI